MSAASALPGDTPPVAGGALPAGQRLLGLVYRMGQTGMAVARCINRIARQRLEGQDISRMAPPGFSATHAHFLVVQAVAWTAALRERLLALAAVRPSLVAAGLPKAARAPQGRGAAHYLPDAVPNPTEDDWHDWRELAKPLRIGPGGVAAAMQQIAGKSNQEVVTGVCDTVSQALVQMGAGADVAGLEAIAAQARALLPELERAADKAAAAPAAEADGAPDGVTADVPPKEPKTAAAAPSDEPEADADDDPPPKPPD